MDNFVCARAIMANAMDLTLFQFDYDMSFAVTFLNADRTVYGRYGSRQHTPEEADKHISMEGLARSMESVLSLHRGYPDNKATLAGKQPRPVEKKRPEEYSTLGKYQDHLDYGGKVAKSCVHCHQIHDAQRLEAWSSDTKITDQVLHPWPMPDMLGLTFDPATVATIGTVAKDSPAATAGLRAGDVLQMLDKQPITSIADIQFILHHAPDPASIDAVIKRDDKAINATLTLAKDWRSKSDIAWRTSTWDLRRVALGGAVLVELPSKEREKLGLADATMALRVKSAGRYGGHAVARKAGIRPDDIYVSFDGKTNLLTETQVIRHILANRKVGDEVLVDYLRNGKRRQARFKIQ